MADKTPIAALFKLTPKEAVEYLQGRGQLAQTFSWQDMWQEERAHQFTVSRLANLDLLQAIRDGITQNVNGDLSRRDWMKNTQALLEQAGWWGRNEVLDPATGETVITTFDPARLKLIFDTNTRMAYSAGLWQRIERNKKTHPYIRYITKRDEKVRLSHRAWDNLTLPVDHPFWKTHFPPNGWRCRCRAMSISQAEYDKGLSPLGETLNKIAPEVKYRDWVNKRTGAIERVPVGIDPGFGYNPGMARNSNIANVALAKMQAATPMLAAQTMRGIVTQPALIKALADDFRVWAESIERPHGDLRNVGVLLPEVVAGLESRNIKPATALLTVRDDDVLHTHRDTKANRILWEIYLALPELVTKPRAVLLDKSKRPALLYVFDVPGDKVGKLVVQIDYEVDVRDAAGKKGKALMNILQTGKVINPNALQDRETYDLLYGEI